jgi:hypothetical protein
MQGCRVTATSASGSLVRPAVLTLRPRQPAARRTVRDFPTPAAVFSRSVRGTARNAGGTCISRVYQRARCAWISCPSSHVRPSSFDSNARQRKETPHTSEKIQWSFTVFSEPSSTISSPRGRAVRRIWRARTGPEQASTPGRPAPGRCHRGASPADAGGRCDRAARLPQGRTSGARRRSGAKGRAGQSPRSSAAYAQ